MRPFVVVLRPGPDWCRITREEYRRQSREFCTQIGRPIDQMNEIVDRWDATFGITYFETRQRMKEIAGAALADVGGAVLVKATEFVADESRAVCFVDDDDWFAPDLGAHLDFGECEALIWSHVAVGFWTYPLHRFPAGASELLCFTNNYAVSGSYVRLHGIDGVVQHWLADAAFRSLRRRAISPFLSVANKHPAAVVFLERNLGGEISGARLRQVVDVFVRGTATVTDEELEGIAWARPHIEATNAHFVRVLASAR